MKKLDDTHVTNKLSTELQAQNHREVPHLNEALELEYSMIPDINHFKLLTIPISSWIWDDDELIWRTEISLEDSIVSEHYFRLNEISVPIFDINTDEATHEMFDEIGRLDIRIYDMNVIEKKAILYAIREVEIDVPLMIYGLKGTPTDKFIDLLSGAGGGVMFYLTFLLNTIAGNPDLSGANITVIPPQGSTKKLVTDLTGKASIVTRQGFKYQWSIEKDRHVFVPSSGTVETLNLVTEVDIGVYELPQLMVTTKGVDFIGRTITANAPSGVVTGTTIQSSDPDKGTAMLDLLLDTYRITCDYPDGQLSVPEEIILDTQPGIIHNVEFEILSKPILKVSVIDRGDRGSEVNRRIIATPAMGTPIIGFTDSNGLFQTNLMHGVSYKIEIETLSGYVSSQAQTIFAQAGQIHEVKFEIFEEAILRVTTSPQTAGVAVSISSDDFQATATTDSSGVVNISNPGGVFNVTYTVPTGFFPLASEQATCTPGQITVLNKTLLKHPVINVQIVDSSGSNNIKNWEVEFIYPGYINHMLSDENGKASFVIPSEGDVTVHVTPNSPDYMEPSSQNITVVANGVYDMVFTVQKFPVINIQYNPASATAGQTVTINGVGFNRTGTIDANGRFTTIALIGTYTVSVTNPPNWGAVSSQQVTTVPNEVHDMEFTTTQGVVINISVGQNTSGVAFAVVCGSQTVNVTTNAQGKATAVMTEYGNTTITGTRPAGHSISGAQTISTSAGNSYDVTFVLTAGFYVVIGYVTSGPSGSSTVQSSGTIRLRRGSTVSNVSSNPSAQFQATCASSCELNTYDLNDNSFGSPPTNRTISMRNSAVVFNPSADNQRFELRCRWAWQVDISAVYDGMTESQAGNIDIRIDWTDWKGAAKNRTGKMTATYDSGNGKWYGKYNAGSANFLDADMDEGQIDKITITPPTPFAQRTDTNIVLPQNLISLVKVM